MQGRLSPPSSGRIQSFPTDSWREEFPLAKEAGLSCIEWIFEFATAAQNPVSSSAGIAEVLALTERHRVGVRSICADCFMERPLVGAEGHVDASAVETLRWLIGQAGALGCRYMVLPFVDSSRVATPDQVQALQIVLASALPP